MARGKVTFNITGGTPPYRVLFRNNTKPKEAYGGYFETPGNNKEIEIAEDASAGAYTLDIIDSNGCVVSETGLTVGTTYMVSISATEEFSIDFGDGDVIADFESRDDRFYIRKYFVPGSYSFTATAASDFVTTSVSFTVTDENINQQITFFRFEF